MSKLTENSSLAPLEARLKHLLDALGRDADDIDYVRIEKITRALLISLKTFEQMRLHEIREAKRKADEAYARFEDLKMPPQAERERMIALLNRHFGVTDEEE